MKVNLKKLTQQKLALDEAIRMLSAIKEKRRIAKHLKDLSSLIDEICTDLEMAGESIPELDKDRLDAIEERDKMLEFFNNEEEI